MLVNCSERKKPPASSATKISQCGVVGRNRRSPRRKQAADRRHCRSARCGSRSARMIGAAVIFMVIAPAALAKVSRPEAKARRGRSRAAASAAAGRAARRCRCGRASRRSMAPAKVGMRSSARSMIGCGARRRAWQTIERQRSDADGEQARRRACRAGRRARRSRSRSIRPARPTPGAGRSRAKSSGRRSASRTISDEEGDQHDAEHADRHVDEEDPAPRAVGDDEAAERRPEHRPDQRRHGEIGHRAAPARISAPMRSSTRRPTGTIIAPPMPWRMRAATSSGSELRDAAADRAQR